MAARKSSLFTMDLRIDKEIVKLKVHEQDSLTDLIDRLSAAIKWKRTPKQKIKAKLEDQFRKITQNTDISHNVKNKLDSLLEQSKIVIIAIETDKNDIGLNQTPFKILQESMLHGRKMTDQKLKKNYQYLNSDGPNLLAKYQSKQLSDEIRNHQGHIQPQFENIILRTKNVSPHKFNSNKKEDSTQIFQKKYQAIDRKCQNFISKHLGSSQNYDYRPTSHSYEPSQANRYANTPIELIQTRQRHYEEANMNSYQQLVRQNEQRIMYQLHCPDNPRALRSKSGNEMNYLEKYKNLQTFQEYKINRYKSNHNFHPKEVQVVQVENNYRPVTSRQNIRPSKSYTKLNAGNDYHSGTIKSYDNYVENKLLSGAGSYKKLKGKYHYLSGEGKFL